MSKKRIALLANITADLIAAGLKKKYDVYIPEGYDTWMQEILDSESGIYRDSFDAVILLLDMTETRSWKDQDGVEERLSSWEQAVQALVGHFLSVPVFLSTLDVRQSRIRALFEPSGRMEPEEHWNQFIKELAESQSNVYVYDLQNWIADVGRNRFYSDKMWYLGSMPYSLEGLKTVTGEIDLLLRSTFEPRRKAIVLDLDNTLWGGVVGEDGVEGIELSDHKEGERFYDFQRQLLEMKKRGILLAVNSKNNMEDVLKVFDEHPYMLLKKEDFVSMKVNWQDKASNMKEIMEELNLTEGSFIFLDDNPMEREVVQGACPDVLIPKFPEDTTTLAVFAERLYDAYMRPLRLMEEDLKKTEMYQVEARRKQEYRLSLNLDDYIVKLEMTVEIHRMRENELERTAQLCGKTNQFNLTTKRYTAAQIRELTQDKDSAVYTVHARDKYGDHGLISVLILQQKGRAAYIDTFLMSCRVMGRKLEDAIIDKIALSYRSHVDKLIGEFIPTAKNRPVANLYDRLGFICTGEQDGSRSYEIDLGSYESRMPKIFKKVDFEV